MKIYEWMNDSGELSTVLELLASNIASELDTDDEKFLSTSRDVVAKRARCLQHMLAYHLFGSPVEQEYIDMLDKFRETHT